MPEAKCKCCSNQEYLAGWCKECYEVCTLKVCHPPTPDFKLERHVPYQVCICGQFLSGEVSHAGIVWTCKDMTIVRSLMDVTNTFRLELEL